MFEGFEGAEIFRFINGWGCRNCYMKNENFAPKNETH